MVLLEEPRGSRILPPLGDVADREVPEVDDVVAVLDEPHAVLTHLDRGRSEQVVDGEARGDRAVVADRLADLDQRLAPEARPVLERAAVAVGASVVVRREELERQVRMGAVDVDDVEAGLARADRGVDVHLLDGVDVVLIHVAGKDVQLEVGRDLRWPTWRRAGLHARRMRAAVPQLDPGECAELVQAVAHRREVAHIALVPDPRRDPRGVVRLGVDRAILGAARTPAALGLHATVVRLHPRLLRAGADAMWHLVEAVLQRLRADPDRLEEDVVLGVARHSPLLS